jgi:hypothetical protein
MHLAKLGEVIATYKLGEEKKKKQMGLTTACCEIKNR